MRKVEVDGRCSFLQVVSQQNVSRRSSNGVHIVDRKQ